jgi:hypothetical protein
MVGQSRLKICWIKKHDVSTDEIIQASIRTNGWHQRNQKALILQEVEIAT